MVNKIIYHQVKKGINCPDGFVAAWEASLLYPNAQIIGCVYIDKNQPMSQWEYPNLKPGDDVLIVDFSFPLELLLYWEKLRVKLQVIDHHKTAMNDLSQFSNAIFDMNECGATLTWKTLFPEKPMPVFIEHIRDRDLWIKTAESPWYGFSLPETAAYHEAMRKLGRSFKLFNKLAPMNREQLRDFLLPIGQPELDKKIAIVEKIAERVEFVDFCNHKPVAHVKLNRSEDRYASDVGSCLYLKYPEVPFVAMLASDNTWSLRSNKLMSNFDVSSLARTYGGGGHHNAAGMVNNSQITLFPVE